MSSSRSHSRITAPLLAVAFAALSTGCSKPAPPPDSAIGGAASSAGGSANGAANGSATDTTAGSAANPASDTARRGSPTAAFYRLRDAVLAKDWGAFYDGMGPTMRQADAADPARAALDASLSPREKFIKGMDDLMAHLGEKSMDGIGPEAFMAIWEGTEVKSESVDGDRATVTVTKAGTEWQELFVREDGEWKFDGAATAATP